MRKMISNVPVPEPAREEILQHAPGPVPVPVPVGEEILQDAPVPVPLPVPVGEEILQHAPVPVVDPLATAAPTTVPEAVPVSYVLDDDSWNKGGTAGTLYTDDLVFENMRRQMGNTPTPTAIERFRYADLDNSEDSWRMVVTMVADADTTDKKLTALENVNDKLTAQIHMYKVTCSSEQKKHAEEMEVK